MTPQHTRRRSRLPGLLLVLWALGGPGAGESLACILTNISSSSPCTADTGGWICPAETEVSFTTYLSAACPIDETIWRVSNLDTGQSDDYSYNVWQPEFSHTFSEGGSYTVKAIVYPTNNPASSKIITVTVPL